jgi:hypothetical protein
MSSASRYHSWMNRFGLGCALLGFTLGLQAQVFGPRASVTSLGDGFTLHNPPGVRASVTSLGPQGFTPRPLFPRGPVAVPSNRPFFRDHRRHFNSGFALPVYAVPYYYADYPVVVDPTDTSMEENYGPPGPTIFDRHGSDASSGELERQYDERLSRLEKQVDEAEASSTPQTTARTEAPQSAVVDQLSTVLVFHDGHTAEVQNYAIVGDVLFDFSTGVRHKIALSDLDLDATQKQNENRGVDFHLPAGSRD